MVRPKTKEEREEWRAQTSNSKGDDKTHNNSDQVQIRQYTSKTATGPDREGQWTRVNMRQVLHGAAVSCAFKVGRYNGGDA